MESAPTVLFIDTPKNSQNNYELKLNDKNYLLTLTLANDKTTPNSKEEKAINFNLKEKSQNNLNNNLCYESEKNLKDLSQLFLINIEKNPNIEEAVFSKIQICHSKNNVLLNKDEKNENILNLIYIQKIVDNDDYEIKIELSKKDDLDYNPKLNKTFDDISKELEKMKLSFEKKLKEKEDENISLKKLLKINEPIKDLEPLVFNSEPDKLTQCKAINDVVDGGRGVNDLFAVYNLVKDPKKTVYIAVKNKVEESQNSYINIIKIKSVDNFTIIQKLYGHNQRIVFIKYYLDPYTEKEYLISADREEMVIVWKILDKNNYKRFCLINTLYGRLMMRQSIYSCIIFFTERKNYIYTTSVTKNYGRLYELEDGSFLRNVSITLNNYTFYLIKYKEYIIDICKDYIMIYNPFSEEIYDKIQNEKTAGDNRSGCIIYNKENSDYLCISNQNGYITIYDLIKKKISKVIKVDGDLYHIISWNLKYLIVAVHNNKCLSIVDIKEKKIKAIKSSASLICVKKFMLNEEEVIFCAGGQGFNSLYIYYLPK